MTNQNIQLLCQFNPDNDQLEIIKSQNFDLQSSDAKYTITDAVGNIIGAMNTTMIELIKEANGPKLYSEGRAFVLEFGYDYAVNLKQARAQYGEQGYRDELTALGRSIIATGIGFAGSEAGKLAGVALVSSSLPGKIGGAIIGGVISSQLYEKFAQQPVENFFINIIDKKFTESSNRTNSVSIGYQQQDSNGNLNFQKNFYQITNSNLVQKNFNSLGIDSSQFDINKNTFNNQTFIDTNLNFNLTNTLSSALSSYNNSYNNNYGSKDSISEVMQNFRSTLSNSFQDAVNYLGNAKNHASPLAIDLDNDGNRERTGWASSADGIMIEGQNNDGNNRNFFVTITRVFASTVFCCGLFLGNALASPEYWPVDDKTVIEMSKFSKSRTEMDITTTKLIEQIIEKYKLDPVRILKDQCELMNKITTYIGLNVVSLGSNGSTCSKNNEACITPYRIVKSKEVYKNGFFEDDNKFNSELIHLVTDSYGRPIGISRSFTKSYAKSSGYYQILQHHRRLPESSNSLQEIIYSEKKPNDGSYLKIDGCYVKEIHLILDELYITRPVRYNQ